MKRTPGSGLRLRENARELSSNDYIQALRFVNQLIRSTRALQGPGAARYFSDWILTAQGVGELVDQMTQRGLLFAAVTLGDEAKYTALHRALVTYASNLPLESLSALHVRSSTRWTGPRRAIKLFARIESAGHGPPLPFLGPRQLRRIDIQWLGQTSPFGPGPFSSASGRSDWPCWSWSPSAARPRRRRAGCS